MQRADTQTPLIAAPAVDIDRTTHCVVWPIGGLPAALDAASRTILDCFVEAATTDEVIDDLVAVLEGDETTLRPVTERVVDALVVSGHLVAASAEPFPAWRLAYPPSASP